MAKKLWKFLLFVSTVGAAFAGAYYFMKSKKSSPAEEDDYEDLDDDSYEDEDSQASGERSYVSLTPESDAPDTAAPVSESPKENTGTTVEEFFDDEDDEDGSLDAI